MLARQIEGSIACHIQTLNSVAHLTKLERGFGPTAPLNQVCEMQRQSPAMPIASVSFPLGNIHTTHGKYLATKCARKPGEQSTQVLTGFPRPFGC